MTRRPRLRRDDGLVAIEFVLVAPVLILLLFSIVTIGGLYSAVVQTTGKARDGARSASIGLSLPAGTSLVGAPCPTPRDPTKNVTVAATDTYTVQIPFTPVFNKTITRQVTMRCGG